MDRLRTIIHNAPEKPSIIGISETHLHKNREQGLPPDIRGYHFYHNNQNSEQGGTCIYIKNSLNSKEIQVEIAKDQRHRITLLETNENIVVEAYAPVKTSLIHIREEFYTALAAAVVNAQERTPNKQIIAKGDFNAHLIGWFSEKTD